MDLLITPLLALVVPHLPALLMKGAEAVAGEAAKKAAFEAVPSGVRAIWAKLGPKVAADAGTAAAVEKVAIEPENAKRVTALEVAIEDLLGELAKTEPTLIGELQELLKTAQAESAASTVVNIDGTDNQAFVNVTAKNVVGKVEGGATFH
jgi:hypothetical protein